jgi:hypothetical protein
MPSRVTFDECSRENRLLAVFLWALVALLVIASWSGWERRQWVRHLVHCPNRASLLFPLRQ